MQYDVIVIGAGAAGIISAITAAKNQKKVLLVEKLSKIGVKLKATGGGKCNLTNTLSNNEFINMFGKHGRFMQDALKIFNHQNLIDFFKQIGVETHAPDGFRIFPTSHNSQTILDALETELNRLNIDIVTMQRVEHILIKEKKMYGIKTQNNIFLSNNIILATGGLGYPKLGSQGDGYILASEIGHTHTSLYPAMIPLNTKETWGKNCIADTMAKVTIKINLKKYKKLIIKGDLIFTKTGIRGPVVLDFAREITPILDKYDDVPILINLTKGMNEEDIRQYINKQMIKNPHNNIEEQLTTLLPINLVQELCKLVDINIKDKFNKLEGLKKVNLFKILAWTPLTIIGHDGFKMAMITRGGINLNEINPKTMESNIVKGLYFCGEVVNLDGPCGGYNLQWSFSSGYLAGYSC